MDRLRQKHDLFVKLGALFGPLLRLVENADQYDEQERAETLARYFAEYRGLQEEFRSFCEGQPGHDYAIQFYRFFTALDGLRGRLVETSAPLELVVGEQLAIAQSAIDAVPIPRASVIMEAGSPFTTYCRLRELCEVDATNSLMWLDPFFDANVFHRYLSNIRQQVPVTLVTTEPSPNAGRRDKTRWTEFLDLSRLFAQERGPSRYRLVVQPSLHDRWVIFDGRRIYSLGGSAKDAGAKDYFTITSVMSSTENLDRIQAHIDSGTEWFGEGTPQHL